MFANIIGCSISNSSHSLLTCDTHTNMYIAIKMHTQNILPLAIKKANETSSYA